MEQDGRICEKLVQLKEAADMTNQQVADLSGVSVATVQRYMSGNVKDLQLDTLRRIILAIGGDPDDLIGGQPEKIDHRDVVALYERMLELANQRHAEELTAVREAHAERLEKQREGYEDRLAKLRETSNERIREYRRWVRILSVAFGVMIVFVMTMLVIDVLHPNAGWIQEIVRGMKDTAGAIWHGGRI